MNNDPLEKVIEARVCRYAKNQGMMTYKFTSPNRASVPDRLLITAAGTVFFIEFKRLGKKPTPAQAREIQRIRDSHVNVFIVDSILAGRLVIDIMKGGHDDD